jgi:hypothetical protein
MADRGLEDPMWQDFGCQRLLMSMPSPGVCDALPRHITCAQVQCGRPFHRREKMRHLCGLTQLVHDSIGKGT